MWPMLMIGRIEDVKASIRDLLAREHDPGLSLPDPSN